MTRIIAITLLVLSMFATRYVAIYLTPPIQLCVGAYCTPDYTAVYP